MIDLHPLSGHFRGILTCVTRQWRAHYRSMISLLASVDSGVRGLVMDTRGEAVPGARIRVEGLEKETSASIRHG